MTHTPLRLARRAALFLILAAAAAAAPAGPIFAQEAKERWVQPAFDFVQIQMPVEIASIKLGGKAVEPWQKIQAGDDWLRGLSFTLKNISDRPISYVEIGLRFPHAADPRNFTVYLLGYGQESRPGESEAARKAGVRPIAPGESVELTLSRDKYPFFQKMLASTGVAAGPETASYFVDRIFFEGEPDVMLRGGTLMRRDANDLNKFNVVGKYTLPSK